MSQPQSSSTKIPAPDSIQLMHAHVAYRVRSRMRKEFGSRRGLKNRLWTREELWDLLTPEERQRPDHAAARVDRWLRQQSRML